MKRGSIIFLKIAVILISLPVILFGSIGLIYLGTHPANPSYAFLLYPSAGLLYLSAIPFFITLYESFELLTYIEKGHTFSEQAVQKLKKIQYCAGAISSFYLLMLPFLFGIAEIDDAPGLIILGSVPMFIAMLIAVFAGVLQKILKEAIAMKAIAKLSN
jgi:choline-glycine betaine transporter